jgi:hypothetical protein
MIRVTAEAERNIKSVMVHNMPRTASVDNEAIKEARNILAKPWYKKQDFWAGIIIGAIISTIIGWL